MRCSPENGTGDELQWLLADAARSAQYRIDEPGTLGDCG